MNKEYQVIYQRNLTVNFNRHNSLRPAIVHANTFASPRRLFGSRNSRLLLLCYCSVKSRQSYPSVIRVGYIFVSESLVIRKRLEIEYLCLKKNHYLIRIHCYTYGNSIYFLLKC